MILGDRVDETWFCNTRLERMASSNWPFSKLKRMSYATISRAEYKKYFSGCFGMSLKKYSEHKFEMFEEDLQVYLEANDMWASLGGLNMTDLSSFIPSETRILFSNTLKEKLPC